MDSKARWPPYRNWVIDLPTALIVEAFQYQPQYQGAPYADTDENDPWVRQVLNLLEHKGAPSLPGYVNYFTDASVLTPALGTPPTIILGPGEATQAHQTDEWCRVDKIHQAVDIYLEISRSWCGA
jgi:acetylornithine deacetylase/succinyl-diaminopimelate desuccinylase-like protein